MSATARKPVIMSANAIEILETISNDLNDLKISHGLVQERLGKPGPEGKGGTGLFGQVAELKTDVRGLLETKSIGRGVLIGIGLVVALAVLGLGGALSAVGPAALAALF